MKILVMQDDFPPRSFGGAGIISYQLAKAFLAKGHEVAVVTAVQNREEVGVSEYEGLKIYKIHSDYHERWQAYLGLYNPNALSEVRKVLAEWRPEVVHAHNIHYHLSYHSLRLAKRSGAKVFLTVHDAMSIHYGKLDRVKKISPWSQLRKYRKRYNPLRNLLIRYYLRYVDKILAVSHSLKEALDKNGIANIGVIHNGIDAGRWQADGRVVEEFRLKHGLVGKKVMMFGGRLSQAKGGDQAVEILAEVAQKVPAAVLLVVGSSNEYSEKMVAQAREHGVGDKLVLTGWISGPELVSAYAASDVVLTLSLYLDPFPTVNLEAMANGKPVVGTCLGGTSEVVLDRQTGYIVDPYDKEAVVGRVIELLLDSKLAQGMGNAGLKRVTAEFTLAKAAEAYLDTFAKIL